jgi:hypothetical protein
MNKSHEFFPLFTFCRSAVPPGARFEPTGPVHPDEMFPGYQPRGPMGKGKPSGRPGAAGPDPDHFSPPGYDDMFS